ncbi:recombinase family protein [Enterobacter cloacae complex sp. 2024EL-00232]|uniref:recombinase family protein n=1 Tax=Enterobacteriaceae TaxID=543 RepID=UPI00178017E5|nr:MULTISPECIES: recombinase family protein [Enterobacteriaceae]EJN7218962.1 recombinase family protein [Citrobacter freundii]MBD5703349.1 recombinase family protein [Citrobacter freundii]MCD2460905.1 recombinase family protein [Enterobacter cloacae complex sp. 2021EL-01261]MDW3091928.1 recombinase family protein [Citrobacter freundii]HED2391440.1 recombinase family protein [Citrobacter freundii]
MATVGYARVSTTGQNLDTQLAALTGCEKIFREKISGAKDDRPELQAMLEFVREGDTVQVTKLDRLARNTRHLLEVSEYLQGKGVALNILNIGINTATPTGKLMLTMIGAIATFEREMMLERQAEGIALAKLKGKYKGRKATARNKSDEVIELLEKGLSKPEISRQLGISITSIYRIIRVTRPDLLETKPCEN